MKKIVTGIFDTYLKAEEVVQELELIGIDGEQVEVISGAAQDVRGRNIISHSGDAHKKRLGERFGHLFGSHEGTQKTADPAQNATPDYAAELERRAGPAIVIVRANDEEGAGRAAEVLRKHGAEKGGPITTLEKDEPALGGEQASNAPTGLGAPGLTTGSDEADLESQGKVLRARNST